MAFGSICDRETSFIDVDGRVVEGDADCCKKYIYGFVLTLRIARIGNRA